MPSESKAQQFLNSLAQNQMNMTALRHLISDSLMYPNAKPWSDQEIVSRIAHDISTGQLIVVARFQYGNVLFKSDPNLFRKAVAKLSKIIALQDELNQCSDPSNLMNLRPKRLASDRLAPYTPIDPAMLIREELSKELTDVKGFSDLLLVTGPTSPGKWSTDTYEYGLEIYGFRFILGQEIRRAFHIGPILASGRCDYFPLEAILIPELEAGEALGALFTASRYASKLIPLITILKYLDITIGKDGITLAVKVGKFKVSTDIADMKDVTVTLKLGKFDVSTKLADPDLKVTWKVNDKISLSAAKSGDVAVSVTTHQLKTKLKYDAAKNAFNVTMTRELPKK